MNKSANAWEPGDTCLIPRGKQQYQGQVLRTMFSPSGDFLVCEVEYAVPYTDWQGNKQVQTHVTYIQSYKLLTTEETRKKRAERFRQQQKHGNKVNMKQVAKLMEAKS